MKTQSRLYAAVLLVGTALSSSTSFAASPREFLQGVVEGANSEIMLGRLASERARSPRVREYGQTLMSDHSQARDRALELGRRYGVRPTMRPTPEARAERDRLMNLNGRDFDREFAEYMVDDHQKDIAEFRDEAREGHGAVSEFARSQLPTLREHLRIATNLATRRGGDRYRGDTARNFDSSDDTRPRADENRNWSDRNDQRYGR